MWPGKGLGFCERGAQAAPEAVVRCATRRGSWAAPSMALARCARGVCLQPCLTQLPSGQPCTANTGPHLHDIRGRSELLPQRAARCPHGPARVSPIRGRTWVADLNWVPALHTAEPVELQRCLRRCQSAPHAMLCSPGRREMRRVRAPSAVHGDRLLRVGLPLGAGYHCMKYTASLSCKRHLQKEHGP